MRAIHNTKMQKGWVYKLVSFSLLFLLILTPIAQGLDPGELEFLKYFIMENYVTPLDYSSLDGSTPQEIFDHLDPNSVYYTEEELRGFLEGITGEFAGIGAYIQQREERIIISQPMKGAPAERAGLLPEDEVIFVEGEDIRGLSLNEVVRRIKGPEGTIVTLGIKRGEEILTFRIERGIIEVNPIEYEVMGGIGYIRINEFNENTRPHFLNAIGELFMNGVSKLIIDLRNNPGGSLEEAVGVSRVLVPRGPIVHVEYRSFKVTYNSFLQAPMFEDMVVLVNEGTASASEILAGALQDTGVATIIGKKTFGKGSVQRIYTLSNGEGFKLTEARYLTPRKRAIDGVGLTPDIEVERFAMDLDFEALDIPINSKELDNQLNYAIEYLNRK